MKTVMVTISALAAGALVVGGWGMAQAEPHGALDHDRVDHQRHDHGQLGEDRRLASPSRQASALPKLFGRVNGDRDLTISDDSVSSGRYKIVVRDSTKRHNWHIFGSGVDRETTVNGTGRWSWRVRLRDGTYTVVCDPHARSMRFTIRVS
jgi:hypothetical protein